MSTVQLTKECCLVGKTEKLSDVGMRSVHAFLGIPYALPPTGERRFQPPQPMQLWQGERQAVEFGAMPLQDMSMLRSITAMKVFPMPANIDNMSEDCLFLNVWTPHMKPKKPLPVMMFVYGGGFESGFSDVYSGLGFCDQHDVVFVSINYRVGLLGFLTTGDDVLPGNLALMDQIEALRWIQKYIGNFGGDPENITIFGESAGAMAVTDLMLIEEAKGLFHRVIAQSGHSLTPGYIRSKESIVKAHRAVLEKLGCTAKSSEEIKSFLAKVDTAALLEATPKRGAFIVPYYDGKLFKDKARTLIRDGRVHPVDLMIGRNSHEGGIKHFFTKMLKGETIANLNKSSMSDFIKDELVRKFGTEADITAMLEIMMNEYAGNDVLEEPEELQKRLLDFNSDLLVTGLCDMAAAIPDMNATYIYNFTHRPSFTFQTEEWIKADHTQELHFLFWDNFASWSKEEKLLAKTMRAYWASFAKNGKPCSPIGPDWPTHTESHPCYMELSLNCQVKQGFINLERDEFWKDAIHKCLKSENPIAFD